MQLEFGEHRVTSEGEYLDQWMHHLRANMSHEERVELFHEAKRDGQAHFSPKLGVHLTLRHNPDGTYRLEK